MRSREPADPHLGWSPFEGRPQTCRPGPVPMQALPAAVGTPMRPRCPDSGASRSCAAMIAAATRAIQMSPLRSPTRSFTRSGKRSCGPVGLERSVGVRSVTKRVAYVSGDAEAEAIVSPNCPDAP